MEADNILEKIHAVAMKFLVSLSLEETYKIIVDEATSLIDAEYGSIILGIGDELQKVYSSSPVTSAITMRRKGNTYKSYNQNKIIVVDIKETGKFYPELKKQGVQSTVFIPLSYQGKPLGVLCIHAKKKIEISASELKTLKLYGSMATIVIRKAQLYKETQDALETRDFFISLASHELRTPLTSINGYIQLLHSRLSDKGTIESKWIQELYGESKRMTILIQELLEINRIKQGTLQFVLRESNMVEVIEKAVLQARAVHSGREIIFSPHKSYKNSLVIGDADKLSQVIFSIIQNAVKFSPDNEPVVVKVRLHQGSYIIQVIDKGSGIERQDVIKVFEGFFKADKDGTEGMGVGLMLAKHIIKYHKGTIEIASEAKKGTSVQITLPVV